MSVVGLSVGIAIGDVVGGIGAPPVPSETLLDVDIEVDESDANVSVTDFQRQMGSMDPARITTLRAVPQQPSQLAEVIDMDPAITIDDGGDS